MKIIQIIKEEIKVCLQMTWYYIYIYIENPKESIKHY